MPHIIYHAGMPYSSETLAMEDATATTIASRPRPRARYTLEARWPHRAVLTTATGPQPDMTPIEMAIAELNARAKVSAP